ncbi:DnaA/Hda family protein [Pelagibius sp. CAU 1746]|uniref:HdaA/DnaA family protein n=1 Tax=Pelagibius sp. CAU 1746 TaxID=3140370 RepID=UPI00325B0066
MTPPAQLPLDLGHRPALAREDFLVAPSNEVAVAWIDRWPDWPANALALFGPAGSGKTHLCQVWRQASGAIQIDADMLRSDEPPAYLGDPEGGVRACVVEDAAGCLSAEPEVARRLLHLYNMMLERRGFLLLSDREAPARWDCPLADLRSRLSGMQAAALGEPDDALIEAVLVKLFADRQLPVNAEVVRFVSARIERSFAAARRVVAAIDRMALAKRRQITVPLARAVLQDMDASQETEDRT